MTTICAYRTFQFHYTLADTIAYNRPNITSQVLTLLEKGKKAVYSSSWEPHLRATGRHLPYGITHLPPDTSERAPPNPSHADWYSIYLPRRDGRLSWPSWLDSAPARSRTSDLSITSSTPNRCTTKTTELVHRAHRARSGLLNYLLTYLLRGYTQARFADSEHHLAVSGQN